jgi:hypothetical protein
MIFLPDRILTRLSYACGALFAAYVVLVVSTIYFASYKTELSSDVREREAAIVALETEYYAAVGSLTASDPGALGFVTPAAVRYVSAVGAPTFTRADR